MAAAPIDFRARALSDLNAGQSPVAAFNDLVALGEAPLQATIDIDSALQDQEIMTVGGFSRGVFDVASTAAVAGGAYTLGVQNTEDAYANQPSDWTLGFGLGALGVGVTGIAVMLLVGFFLWKAAN